MGCDASKVKEADDAWGSHSVVLGRNGNVDFSSRKIDFFGSKHICLLPTSQHRSVRKLTLSDNKLYVLSKDISCFPNIEIIKMDRNKFERLPAALTQLRELQVIDVSRNPLSSPRAFDILPKLTSLTELHVRECGIEEFPLCILDCTEIRIIDLSENERLNISGVNFAALTKLEVLNLSGCGLNGNVLPFGVRGIASLAELDLSNNFFRFDEGTNFFGKSISESLRTLHLRGCNLSAVPQVVVSLRKLEELDLSENPIETVNVLAGRLVVRRPMNRQDGSSSALDDETVSISSKQSTGSRVSQASRAGAIGQVSRLIPLKKLVLRNCDFVTVPKYFHKLVSLEELDLSDNEKLNDPNLTLFSFPNLRSLSITGCPFALSPARSRNEWFDIAKLTRLNEIRWEVWKGEYNLNPYRTKVPFEICGLPIKTMNDAPVRPNLFTGDVIDTIINIMRDSYYKVDVAMEEESVNHHANAVLNLQLLQPFYFPLSVPRTGDNSPVAAAVPGKQAQAAKGSDGAIPSPVTGTKELLVDGEKLGELRQRIVLSRYVFFLAMQAANFDAVIIPPKDVAAMHYAQMTTDPQSYRDDCEAICGRLLDCNYRSFFHPVEDSDGKSKRQKKNQQLNEDMIAASRKVWNMMVRTTQQDLRWLRYDFWEKLKQWTLRMSFTGEASVNVVPKEISENPKDAAHGTPSGPTTTGEGSEMRSPIGGKDEDGLSSPPLRRASSVSQDFRNRVVADSALVEMQKLQRYHSPDDLSNVLDRSITSHFLEKGIETYATSLREFFRYGEVFIEKEAELRSMKLEWSRYVKFITMFAFRWRGLNGNFSEAACTEESSAAANDPTAEGMIPMRQRSLLGPRYDAPSNLSFIGPDAFLPTAPAKLSSYAQPVKRKSALGSVGGNSTNTGGRRDEGGGLHSVRVQCNPVPTVGLTFLLHTHRTAHIKYFQTLVLLGIDSTEVEWNETRGDTILTCSAWEALFHEKYLDLSLSSDVPEGNFRIPTITRESSAFHPRPRTSAPSALVQRNAKGKRGGPKQVSICGGDSTSLF